MDYEPSRRGRSDYVWRIGVLWFGGLSAVLLVLSDIWRGRWPRVPVGLTSAFALELAREVLTVILVSVITGMLFGYAMWHFVRWFINERD